MAHACFQDFEEIADHEVFECWDHMAASKETMSKSAFAELEKNTGWRYDAKGLLAQADLRHLALPSRIRFDVLHCFFQTGICSVEVGLFKKNWEAASKSWADLVEMVASLDLTVPASDSAKIAGKCRWLKPACFNEQGVWRCRGSEQADTLPFLFFVAAVLLAGEVQGELEKARSSLVLMCERLFCLQMLRCSGSDDWANDLTRKQEEHHRQFLACYSADKCKPKHHYGSHLPGHGFVEDSFVEKHALNHPKP